MANILDILALLGRSLNEMDDERREELRKEFEESMNEKYNRGTVVAAMSNGDWSSYDIEQVLKYCETSEQAEAAVGMVKSGNFSSWDITQVLKRM